MYGYIMLNVLVKGIICILSTSSNIMKLCTEYVCCDCSIK